MKKIFALISLLLIITIVGCTKKSPNDSEITQVQCNGLYYAKVDYVTPSISSLRYDMTIEIKDDKLYISDREYQLETQNFIDNFSNIQYLIENDFEFPQTGLSATKGEDTFKDCYIFLKNKNSDIYMFEISQNLKDNINNIITSYKLETCNEEKESLIDLSLYLKNVERVSGYYGPISSYIFNSDNKNLIDYLEKKASNIKFTEILTDENKDEVNFGRDRNFTFYLQESRIILHLTNVGNMYAIYEKDILDSNLESAYTTETVWSYKAIQPKEINYFSIFTGLGFPINRYWCNTPVCTKYIDGLAEYIQDSIVYTFIDKFSPLNEFFEYGTLFSGWINSYFGKYDDAYYAVIIDGCGFYYTEAEWIDIVDGVSFKYNNGNQIYLISPSYECYDLHSAFNNEILSHDDLAKIANLLN